MEVLDEGASNNMCEISHTGLEHSQGRTNTMSGQQNTMLASEKYNVGMEKSALEKYHVASEKHNVGIGKIQYQH